MDFRVYVIIEVPILEKKYELLVPIDRKINDLILLTESAIISLTFLEFFNLENRILIFLWLSSLNIEKNDSIPNIINILILSDCVSFIADSNLINPSSQLVE